MAYYNKQKTRSFIISKQMQKCSEFQKYLKIVCVYIFRPLKTVALLSIIDNRKQIVWLIKNTIKHDGFISMNKEDE